MVVQIFALLSSIGVQCFLCSLVRKKKWNFGSLYGSDFCWLFTDYLSYKSGYNKFIFTADIAPMIQNQGGCFDVNSSVSDHWSKTDEFRRFESKIQVKLIIYEITTRKVCFLNIPILCNRIFICWCSLVLVSTCEKNSNFSGAIISDQQIFKPSIT